MKLICALLGLLLVPSLAHAEPFGELVSDFERFDVRCGLVLRAPVHPRLHVATSPAVPTSAEGRFIACHVDDPDALILVEQVRLERHFKHADGSHAHSIFADALSAITADSFAQDTATTHGTRAKVDMALIIGSVTFSGVAAAYTVLCEAAKICHEVNPVMQRLLGRGLPTVIVFKASVNAAAHYLVWRFAPEGKWRTVMLGVIGGINAADAINDGRVVRRALKARG